MTRDLKISFLNHSAKGATKVLVSMHIGVILKEALSVCSRPSRTMISNITWAVSWQNQQSECAPSKDSDQPGHSPSLIRVLAVRMKKAWVLSYPLSASKDSDQTGWMPRLIWVFAGCTATLLVLSRGGSLDCCILKRYTVMIQNIQTDKSGQTL